MSTASTSKPIVVGVDGSEGSRRALSWAIEEAAARPLVVRAVTVWQRSYDYGSDDYWPIDEHIASRAGAQLAQAVQDAGGDYPSVQIEQLVLEGDAAQILCEQAEDAGLLVVGSRGRGEFKKLLLGSVSIKCARHSRCPIVIVPDPTNRNGR